MAKATLAMDIRIGRSSRKFGAQHNAAVDYFSDRLLDESVSLSAASSMIRLRGLEKRMNRAVTSSLNEGVQWAARNLIGQHSPRPETSTGRGLFKTLYFEQASGADTGTTFHISSRGSRLAIRADQFRTQGAQELHWRNLASATRRRKSQNQEQFFLHTGSLRSQLKSMAKSIIQNTGVVRVNFIDQNGRSRPVGANTGQINTNVKISGRRVSQTHVPLGHLRFTFLPNIPRSFLPGLRTGKLGAFDQNMKFERAAGVGGELLEKLQGPTVRGIHYHRPLLQPVFTFWTLFHLPKKVADNLVTVMNL